MTIGVVHHFPGGTKAQYDAVAKVVHGPNGELPDGQIFHSAGRSAGGWTVIAVHESQDSWERFRNEILIPRLQEGISGGFDTPPEESIIEIEYLLP